jgi:signal transduction histidine kinase
MRRLGLQGRLILAGLPATAGLAIAAAMVLTGNGDAADTPAFGGGALALAVVGLVLGIAISRRTIATLDAAIDAAEAVTPAAVLDDLAITMATGRRPLPAPAGAVDPVSAPLAHTVATLTTTALAAAYEHGEAVRASVNDAVIRLARHNQGLLDRLLGLLDDLEDAELDPDGLERLFKLDHLATQMRRRNDALMVLAAVESSDTQTATVAVRDVLRGAVSAVEAFTRVVIDSSAVAALPSPVASNLALLLAEVIDNAARASHVTTSVHVSAAVTPAGLVIEVSDDGPGFSGADLREVAALFDIRAAAPTYLPQDRRGLGLVIAARVADRYGLRVSFATNGLSGGHVTIEVPARLVARQEVGEEPEIEGTAVPIVVAQARRHDRLLARQNAGAAGDDTPTPFVDWQPTAPRVPPSVVTVDTHVPAPTTFRPAPAAMRAEGLPGEPAPAAAVPVERPQPIDALYRVAAPGRPGSSSLLGATDQVAVGGLVRRVPGASLRDDELGSAGPGDTDAGLRDPEAVRARLTSYRDGLARGRGDARDRSPHEGR